MQARFAIIASLLALGACQPPATETATPADGATIAPAETAAANGCNVSVEKPWIDQETPVRRYTAHAAVLGPTCDQGVAVLVIRQREGSPLYTWSGLTNYLFGLKDAHNPAAMKTALMEWIDQGNVMNNTTDTLPPWEETDGQPRRTEFPFMPESWFDKAAWDALKAEKLDMFCFPQGSESTKCAVLRQGTADQPASMEEIGLHLFPG